MQNQGLIERLARAVRQARTEAALRLSPEARTLWWDTYPRLSAGAPGLLGAILGRAEAHVVRLALVYALLDESDAIDLGHLQAGLALWDYAARSATFIFGDSLGDRVADEIWKAIAKAASGITRSEIRDLLDRNKSKAEIDSALGVLVAAGRVERKAVTGRGRPSELWSARPVAL